MVKWRWGMEDGVTGEKDWGRRLRDRGRKIREEGKRDRGERGREKVNELWGNEVEGYSNRNGWKKEGRVRDKIEITPKKMTPNNFSTNSKYTIFSAILISKHLWISSIHNGDCSRILDSSFSPPSRLPSRLPFPSLLHPVRSSTRWRGQCSIRSSLMANKPVGAQWRTARDCRINWL